LNGNFGNFKFALLTVFTIIRFTCGWLLHPREVTRVGGRRNNSLIYAG
jgi:hypothetical protein